MGVLQGVKIAVESVAGRRDHEVMYECRRCGRGLDDDTSSCPGCGGDEIAQFTF